MTAPIRIVMLPLKSPLSLFMFDTILFSEFVGKQKKRDRTKLSVSF